MPRVQGPRADRERKGGADQLSLCFLNTLTVRKTISCGLASPVTGVLRLERSEKWWTNIQDYVETLRQRLHLPSFSVPNFRGKSLLAYQLIYDSVFPTSHNPISISYDVTFAISFTCLDAEDLEVCMQCL